MRTLFRTCCSEELFRHDNEMRELHRGQSPSPSLSQKTSTSADSDSSQGSHDSASSLQIITPPDRECPVKQGTLEDFGPSSAVRPQENSISMLKDVSSSSPQDGKQTNGLKRKQDGSNAQHAECQGIEPSVSLTASWGNESESSHRKRPRIRVDGSASSSFSCDDVVHTPDSDSEPCLLLKYKYRTYDDPNRGWDNGQEYCYYDDQDNVLRCTECRCELWTPQGPCTGGCKFYDLPYFEVMMSDCEAGDEYPGIVPWEGYPDDDVESEKRVELTGIYLDGASAYDSEEDSASVNYQGSFIDDASIHDDAGDNAAPSSDEEIDWQERYRQLASAHEALNEEHNDSVLEHEEMRRDVLGSDYDSENYEDLSEEEDVLAIVDVDVQDPQVAEVVVPQEASQVSEISDGRLAARVEAFHATLSDEGAGWHDISLISTGDNHTELEMGL